MSRADPQARTLLAAPITHAEQPIDQQVRTALRSGADIVELRVDLIGEIEAVEAFLRRTDRPACILTIRTHSEGGKWDADEDERVALFERLGLLNPGYVDVELRTWQRSANVRQKLGLVCERLEGGEPDSQTSRAKNQLILSLHDFRDDSRRDEYWAELLASPAPIVKLALTPRDATGAIELLQLARSSERRCIVVAMGEAGLSTRVLAKKCGALLSFAATEERSLSAPGQIALSELHQLYRWGEISSSTRIYGVIGWPVTHSRSPHFHNRAMQRARIDGVYLPFPVRPEREDFWRFMQAVTESAELDFAGFSVTIPHKRHAFDWLGERGGHLSDWARRCGAVNTLRRLDGQWQGDNTDAAGALHALGTNRDLRHSSWIGRKVAVLGAGGAARAIIAALSELGCSVTVYNRTLSTAQALAQPSKVTAEPWENRVEHDADLLINCTPVGMVPATAESPMPRKGLRPGLVVFDTIYNPPVTQLLQDAAAAGCAILSGEDMFLGQAGAQFRWWHGVAPPG